LPGPARKAFLFIIGKFKIWKALLYSQRQESVVMKQGSEGPLFDHGRPQGGKRAFASWKLNQGIKISGKPEVNS